MVGEDTTMNTTNPVASGTELLSGENEGAGSELLNTGYIKSDAFTPTTTSTGKTSTKGCFSFLSSETENEKKRDYEKGLKRRVYWDKSGALRFEMIKTVHNAETELRTMLKLDNGFISAKEKIYVISTRWLSEWVCFVSHGDVTPGPISNSRLVNKHTNTILKKALFNKHWRPLNKDVWEYLVSTYGGGPSIMVENGPTDLATKEEIEEYMNKMELQKTAILGGIIPAV